MSDSNVPSVPMDPNLGKVQGSAYDTAQGIGQYAPQTQAIYYNQASNPYTGQAMQGAQAAGTAGQAQGNANLTNAGYFQNMPSQLSPYVMEALQTGFDPENALYSKYSQASKDATNADISMRGLGSSPWGSGLASEADQNFQLGWADRALGRQAQGASTASGLLGASEGAAKTGAGLGAQGARQIYEGGALPYITETGFNMDLASVVPYLTSNQQQQFQDYMNYYGAANQNTNAAIQAGRYQDMSDQAFGNSIGSTIGGIFGMAGGGGGSSGGGGGGMGGMMSGLGNWMGGGGAAAGGGDAMAAGGGEAMGGGGSWLAALFA